MKVLDPDRYKIAFKYKNFDICTLKIASPLMGDYMGYIIDDEQFKNHKFDLLDQAIRFIDTIKEGVY